MLYEWHQRHPLSHAIEGWARRFRIFYKLVSAEKIPFPTPVEPQRLLQFLSFIYIDKFA